MSSSLFSSSDYLGALQSLFPRGRVWPRDADATQTAVLSGLTPSYARQDAASVGLLVDAFPATTVQLLPEWQASLGLPDSNAGPAPTVAKAQTQIVAKLANGGGQSIAYYVSYGAQLGIPITVKPLAPFRMGQSSMGQQLGGPDWVYAWVITAKTSGGEYAAWDMASLRDQLQSMAPAHTILTINFT